MESIITDMKARIVLDSRGNETIEVEVYTRKGYGIFSSPSGASKGKFEAISYPDNNIYKSLEEFKKLKDKIIGHDALDQETIDNIIEKHDGTENFSKIGGNLAVAISLATAVAAANTLRIPLFKYIGGITAKHLPLPLGNVIGGGAHAINSTDFQEFLVIPNTDSFRTACLINATIHKKIKQKIKADYPLGKGDEGAWSVSLSNEEALKVLRETVNEVSREFNTRINIGLDIAATELYDEKKALYVYRDKKMTREEHINYVIELAKKYDLFYIEDPVHEEDYEGFETIKKELRNCLICGDDLFATNYKRIRNVANAIIIKPNQAGTLTRTLRAVKEARKHGMILVTAHRSGETESNVISHIAVGIQSEIVKFGVVSGERISKLNELIRLEDKYNLKPINLSLLSNH